MMDLSDADVFDVMCILLDTVPQRDGRTDGLTDRSGKSRSRCQRSDARWRAKANCKQITVVLLHNKRKMYI